VRPGTRRPTDVIDVVLRPVRGLDHAVTGRGAFKIYLGSAEVDARVRFIEPRTLEPNGEAFARLALAEPIVADAFDRFVLRESGRRETVAGGTVLDQHPARRRLTGPALGKRAAQLRARRDAGPDGFARAVVAERGFVPLTDLTWLAGEADPSGPLRGYAVSDGWPKEVTEHVIDILTRYHRQTPLTRGMPREEVKEVLGIEDAR